MTDRYLEWLRYACALIVLVMSSWAVADEPVALVEDGQAKAVIVVADDAMPLPDDWRLKWSTHDAAAFLQDYIEQASGATLPIVRESEAAATDNVILIGDTQRGRALGISPADLPGEGYRIKSFDGGVAVVGEIHEGVDRGTLLGVYDLLERVADVRWYFPGDVGTIVPRHDSLTVDELDVTNHPRFEVRVGGVGHWQTDVARQWHPALRFGMREGLVANHTHEGWNDRFGQSHPEYFGLRADGTRAITDDRAPSGQSRAYLCYSEPAVLEQHLADADAWFDRGDAGGWHLSVQPRGNIIPFGPSDVRQVCVCEDCSKLIDRSRGRYGFSSDLIFDFIVRFAERLKERHPDAILAVMAYDHYQLPPTNIDRLPDNVMVTLCLLPTLTQSPHPEIREEIDQTIETWSRLVNHNRGRLIIWDYFVYPNTWFTAPTAIPHVLQRYTKSFEDRALGIFNNGFNPTTRQEPKAYLTWRNVWMMHKLLWNPDLDVEQARYDWSHDLFGPAGDVMDAFYALLEERWQQTPWTRRPQSATVKHRRVYGEVYTPEVITELKRLLAEAIALCPAGSEARQRLDWFAREAFGPFFAEADAHHQTRDKLPQEQISRVDEAPAIDGRLDEAVWQHAAPMTLVDKRNALPAAQASRVYAGWDDQHLYIAAQLELDDASKVAANVEAAAADDDRLINDDLFVINLASGNPSRGYVELAINPNGAWSTSVDVFERRNLLTTTRLIDWPNGQTPRVAATVDGDVWTVEAAVPWAALPELDNSPERLHAQFVRWSQTMRYHFDSWSATLEPWGYALDRFGSLVLSKKVVRTESVSLPAVEVAQMSRRVFDAAPKSTANPVEMTAKRRSFFIVGQRDMDDEMGLDVRSVLRFDLSDLPNDPTKIARVTLDIHLGNAIRTIGGADGQPIAGLPPLVNPDQPFDPVVVDHITTTKAEGISAADNDALPLRGNIGTIYKGKARLRHTYSLDVTDRVRADLAAGRTSSTFRLRLRDGYTVRDGHSHYLIFRAYADNYPGQVPQLTVKVRE